MLYIPFQDPSCGSIPFRAGLRRTIGVTLPRCRKSVQQQRPKRRMRRSSHARVAPLGRADLRQSRSTVVRKSGPLAAAGGTPRAPFRVRGCNACNGACTGSVSSALRSSDSRNAKLRERHWNERAVTLSAFWVHQGMDHRFRGWSGALSNTHSRQGRLL